MKLLTLLLFGILLLPSSLFSQSEADQIREELSLIQGQSNLGTDFWFAMPNVYEGNNENDAYLVITSMKDSYINITCKKNNFIVNEFIKAGSNKIISLSSYKFDLIDKDYDSKEDTTIIIESAAINIQSEYPVSVQLVNSHLGLLDGNTLIPTNSLGNEFLFQSYFSYSLIRNNGSRRSFSPCANIAAPYDGTIVDLKLPTYNKELKIRFDNGDSLMAGESISIELNKGDVWNIFSVDTIGDLSGSIIKSSKPVNVLYSQYYMIQKTEKSFPAEKSIPEIVHSTVLPINTWGKTYAIPTYIELNEFPTIRIFTQREDTKIYRNGEYWTTINNSNKNEIFESKIWTDRNRKEEFGIISPTIVTADNPISIMVFSDFSTRQENLFYISSNVNILSPIEQSVNFASFSLFSQNNTLSYIDSAYVNKLELYFEIDESNEIPSDLEFSILDSNNSNIEWNSIKDYYGNTFSSIEFNGISYAAKEIILPDSCNYFIRSNISKFSGYFYKTTLHPSVFLGGGILIEDHYAFPIGMTIRDLTKSDTKTPIVTLNEYYNGNKINGLVYDNHENTSKLAQLYLLEEYTSNFEFKIISADRGFISDSEGNSFVSGEPVQLEFELNKIEADKDAFAVIYTSDRAGNDTLIFINEDIFTSIEPQETLSEYMLVTQQSIEILPNAIADGFTELEIFDMNGSKVATADITAERNISLNSLLSGSYVITLKSDERLLTRKMNMVR